MTPIRARAARNAALPLSGVMWKTVSENALNVYAVREAEAREYRRACGRTLMLEQNKDAYPCDFYLSDRYRLGDVGPDRLQRILDHPAYRDFLRPKEALPEECRRCDRLRLCYGGCPRNRIRDSSGRIAGPEYFCSTYRRFSNYAHEKLKLLAHKLRTRWLIEHAQAASPGRAATTLALEAAEKNTRDAVLENPG